MEAYLDNCVVSGMVRGDLAAAEMAVIPVLKVAVENGRLRLVTSQESHREQDRATDPNVRAMLKQARPEVPLVAENEKLLGFNIQDEPFTFISSPMLTEYVDADLYEKFKKANLTDGDARHLMYAVHNKCDRFVTTDHGFLSRRTELAALCRSPDAWRVCDKEYHFMKLGMRRRRSFITFRLFASALTPTFHTCIAATIGLRRTLGWNAW
ncbi:MAG: hypothetical protein WB689_40425 [Xanthobacteraceae bacterium]